MPSPDEISSLEHCVAMDSSHNWIFQRSERYRDLGVLMICYCNRCGAEKLTLTTRFPEPTFR
ncbi:MAG TPA: hypothetical protein VFF30_01145 [Nitrososphaerales archaeon]|nr:hypothetical protein [Nitrososphaerales archaeon]